MTNSKPTPNQSQIRSSDITPPPELVGQWEEQFLERPTINGCFIQSYIAAKAARWGADQELEACCEWFKEEGWNSCHPEALRASRRPRPEPPSLKEQALAELVDAYDEDKIDDSTYNTIRRALEEEFHDRNQALPLTKMVEIRQKLLAIAAELENTND
jgi:hypothetical protein